jgi:hypothetical protein
MTSKIVALVPKDTNKVRIYVNGETHNTPTNNCIIVSKTHETHIRNLTICWHTSGYAVVLMKNNKKCYLHRYIIIYIEHKTIPKNYVVHHKNSLKFDNTIDNLEITTQAHNMAACDKIDGTTSQYKGVDFHPVSNKWRSRIKYKKQEIMIGLYDNEREAAIQYDISYFAIHGSCTGSNNLLTPDDKKEILADVQKFIPSLKKDSRKLPQFITKNRNSFRVMMKIGDVCVCKYFNNLDDATTFRNQLLTYRENLNKDQQDTNILRNTQGIATIKAKIYKSNNYVDVLIDDDDYLSLYERTWYISQDGYVVDSKNNKMHILILQNTDDIKVIDHINRNKLDCRKENLRIVSRSLNSRNCSYKNKDSSSVHRGVTWSKWAKKWKASICVDGKQCHLGYFNNEQDASNKYELEYSLLEKKEIIG